VQTYGNPNVTYAWYAGNTGVTNRSGRFIASHIGHTGLICFGAGANTLFELARYNPALPMGEQGMVSLPHLATYGLGGCENGVITDPYALTVVAVFHLIFSAVYAGGAMLHSFRYKEKLEDYPAGSRPNKFAFDWTDPNIEFNVQFVNPKNKYFNWSHTVIDSRDNMIDEIQYGYNTEEFIIDDSDKGEWLINIENFTIENQDNPTYLKYTVYKNYGRPNQIKKVMVINLSEVKQKINLDRLMYYN